MKRFLLALAVTLFALWVRLPVLRQGLWEDEATAVYVAESPTIHEFVHRQAAIDYSPPLFNALLAGYGRVFGFGEVPVKALGIGLGALACGAIALAAAETFGSPAAGLLAGLFAAENPLLIDMSSEVRPYSLSGLLAALSVWAVFRWRRGKTSGTSMRADLVLAALLLALTAMSHYAGTVAVAAIGIFALAAAVRRDNRPVWLPVFYCAVAAGIVFLPWAPVAWNQVHVGFPWAGKARPSVTWFKVLCLFPGIPGTATSWTVLGLALAAAAALAASPFVREELRRRGPAILLLLLSAAAPFFAVGLKAPPPRYVTVPVSLSLALLGGLAVIVLQGSSRAGVWERRTAATAAGVMALCALAKSAEAHGRSTAAARAGSPKTIMRGFFRDGTLRPGDLVIGAPDMIGPTLWYYAPSGVTVRGFVHWSEPAFEEFGDYARLWPDPSVVERCLAALDRDVADVGPKRIALAWAVGGDGALPFKTRTDELREGIRRRFPLAGTREFRGPGERIRIDFFDVSRAAAK